MSSLLRATSVAVFAFLALVALSACSPPDNKPVTRIKIIGAWTMATPPGADVGAGYLQIVNEGSAPVRLAGGTTPAAASVEVHMMAMDNGVMRMRPASEGLEIAAGASAELQPGGYHLMLIGLKAPLVEGGSVPITLTFDGGTQVEATLAVRAMGGGHGH